MKEDRNKKIEVTRQIWDTVIDYEKAWLKAHNNANIPVQKLLEYFGAQIICEMYGCSVATEGIAKELIMEAFK